MQAQALENTRSSIDNSRTDVLEVFALVIYLSFVKNFSVIPFLLFTIYVVAAT